MSVSICSTKQKHMHIVRRTLCNTEPESKQPRDDDGKGTKVAGHSCEPQAAAARQRPQPWGRRAQTWAAGEAGSRHAGQQIQSRRYRQKQSTRCHITYHRHSISALGNLSTTGATEESLAPEFSMLNYCVCSWCASKIPRWKETSKETHSK